MVAVGYLLPPLLKAGLEAARGYAGGQGSWAGYAGGQAGHAGKFIRVKNGQGKAR